MDNVVVWKPLHPEKTNMWAFMQFVNDRHGQHFTTYPELHAWSINHCAVFWETLSQFFSIQFDTAPTEILNSYKEMLDARWFADAKLNYAEQLLQKNDDSLAIISVDEQNNRYTLTYKELKEAVMACAEGLRQAGIKEGDRVAAILPNVSYTVIAFLATASIGAIWSSCSTDFGLNSAFDRLGQIEPKLLFISNGHQYNGKIFNDLEKGEEITKLMPTVEKVVVCPVLKIQDAETLFPKAILWDGFIKPGAPEKFTSLPFAHPLYILFSSGTTGKPKCIIHGAGGVLLQHLKELALHSDISETDNLFFYTTCGWMMWNWMVSVLARGATLTLYEGSPTYPDASQLFKLIEKEKVSVFGTSAKFISTIEKAGIAPKEQFSLSHLRCILSTGSPLLPKNYDFVYEKIKSDVQLCSISGGTDIVSCFALGNPILPIYRGELQCFGLGMAVDVFDDQGQSIKGARGELVCTKPFPTMPIGFWNDPDKKLFTHAYFERFPTIWAHGDFAEITPHNGLIIYGRSDAVLNPGGVRIGTAEIYRQVEKIAEVLDSVVIGQDWEDDVRVILFVKLREKLILDEPLKKKIIQTIRDNASPRHVPAKIIQVGDIPRTINGKVVELAVREVVHGRAVNNLRSLANPEALEFFKNRDELKVL
ncbi:acetyl-CoA synthetase (plasmid) [Legionella adelaidensis]|uniref:Acetyl-CoA synthetase n=1 Tax=Legionella adelaidensis TaxID=45056 RepID=A0A0W0R3D5_9GAMM|nr:acetoacetate--CoA ligase [Legionella adelaidensis]KTC65572.1 acetyl-CoA synthetase [Legionella adelaidensis]VEH85740.1 acetyl-CoA synthetase [Legionella adelaidensis]